MVNLCSPCFQGTTGVCVSVGDCALIFGMVVDIVTDPACECPCHEGHACVMPRRLSRQGLLNPEGLTNSPRSRVLS